MTQGVVAAGHPLTAEAGARALREGGNAVDAALAAMLTSCVAEPLLTGLGAGGYMIVTPPEEPAEALDFFAEAPGRAGTEGAAPMREVVISFGGDATQGFHLGAASVGVYGVPAGIAEAAARYGSLPLEDLAEPAARLARDGVEITPMQAYMFELLGAIVGHSPEGAALLLPAGRPPRAGERLRNPELGDSLELLAREGAAPFYTGEIARATCAWLGARGGVLGAEDLAAYRAVPRTPLLVGYRDRDVLTNPPPSAGGVLIAYALALLGRQDGPPGPAALVAAMEAAQAERTPAFLAGLDDPGFLGRFAGGRLGSTTHISVLDEDGWACGVTCTNGEGSSEVVPGTGIHLNNILGEEDLSPLGLGAHPAGRRLPSMMAPTVVAADGQPEVVVGSAGSNRIRSTILQIISGMVDRGLGAQAAVDAPRLHVERGVLHHEPGIDVAGLGAPGRALAPFRARNLFFGGAQVARRDRETGRFEGGGDPRRGGAVVLVEDD